MLVFHMHEIGIVNCSIWNWNKNRDLKQRNEEEFNHQDILKELTKRTHQLSSR
jgi:hypothetical protein